MMGSRARTAFAYAVPSVSDRRWPLQVVRETSPAGPRAPRLLERVRGAIRARHMSRSTEESYVGWIRRYILFHGKRHPAEMGAPEVTRFLTRAGGPRESRGLHPEPSPERAAVSLSPGAGVDLPWLDGVVRALTPERLPVVLTRDEVRAILQRLEGVPRLMAYLLYGAGLRLLECCRLRVQDVDFAANQIVVRNGKGQKDRVTMLPAAIKADLARHLEGVRAQHQRDLPRGAGLGRAARLRWAASIPTPAASGDGSGSFPRPASTSTATPASGAGTTSTKRCSSGAVKIAVLRRRDREARHAAHAAPLVRDASPRGRVRHPHRSRAPRASRRQNDHDLHARAEPGTRRRPEPGGPDAPVRTRRAVAAGPESHWSAHRPGRGAAPDPSRTQEQALTRLSIAAGPADRLTGPAAFGVFGSSAE